MQNVVKFITSVVNKNHNHYYYETFLKLCSFNEYKNAILD